MKTDDVYERLVAVLAELAEANAEAPVIVEGERDVRALRGLGLTGEILTVNRGSSVFHLCERIAADHRQVVILTDWDVHGGQLARLLRDGLAANGVKFNDDVRARIAALCQKEIKAVEDLSTYVERIRPRGEDGRRRLRANREWYAGRSRRR
ncbi:MAG TPA: toprim domain-containing protein [Thermoplasmata archaeon]|jgi:5S rRNA maturation endonuclease (ribonuclease M5)|nr:toprim domain-containing protein [Thermoplasmata archaeon]